MEKETEGDSRDTVTNGIFPGPLEELALPRGGRGCAGERPRRYHRNATQVVTKVTDKGG